MKAVNENDPIQMRRAIQGLDQTVTVLNAAMPANTIKGNNTSATAAADNLTATEVTAMLDVMIGDSGSGGTAGLLAAPAAGDAAAGKFASAAGGYAVPSGTGAPTDAKYVTLATNATLSQERVLTGTANQITITDNGAGGTAVVSIPNSPTLPGTTTGTFSGNLTGNVTGNVSGSAGSFTGSLVGDVTGTQGATIVSTVGAVTAANVAAGATAANAATSANTASKIVARDGSGNFAAGTITAALTGNVTGNLTGNVTGNVSGSSGSCTGNAATATLAATVTTNANLTGDVTSVGNATTLANAGGGAAGPTGSATVAPIVTVDAKGRVTALSSATITPAIGNITGLGTGVATALAINVGSAGAPVTNGGALGTPSGGTLTNATGLPTTGLTGTITNAQLAGSIDLTTKVTGILPAADMPALTGDVTTSAGAVATTIAAGAVTLAKTASAARVNYNYVINGGFDFAQRFLAPGTVASNGLSLVLGTDKYSADRWKVSAANADVQYVRTDTNGALETGLNARYYGGFKKITNTGKMCVYQIIEGINTLPLAGRSVTFQCKLKLAASTGTVRLGLMQLNSSGAIDTVPAFVPTTWGSDTVNPTLGSNLALITPDAIPTGANGSIRNSAVDCALTTTWQLFSGTFTMPANAKNIVPVVFTDAGVAAGVIMYMSEAGFYDGASIRDWLPRLAQQELALCEEFGFRPDNVDFDAILLSSTKIAITNFALPVKLRAVPTLVHNITAWTGGAPTGTQVASFNYAAAGFTTITGALTVAYYAVNSTNIVGVQFTPGTSFSGTAGTYLDLVIGSGVILFFDAEL